MILENIRPFINYRFGSIRLYARLKITVVRFDNLGEFMRQVIFRTLIIILDDRGAYLRRRNRKNCADHPIGPTPKAIKSHKINILIKNTTKHSQNKLYLKRLSLLSSISVRSFICIVPLSNNTSNSLANISRRLTSTTSILSLLATSFNLLGCC